jgi:uncharacterized repeat protein (TIGR03806 family)
MRASPLLKRSARPLCALIVGVLLALLACTPDVACGATNNVAVTDYVFIPADITNNVGDTVLWTWVTDDHSTTSQAPGLWDSGLQPTPFTFSQTFSSAGSYPYFCTAHIFVGMVGSVTVQGSQAPPTITVTLSSPGSNATFVAPWTGRIEGTDADSDGTVTNLEFFANGASLGSLINPATNFSFTVANLAAGSYNLTAVATDDTGSTNVSNAVEIQVLTPVPIRLSSPQRLSAKSFQFQYTATPGLSYVVQRASVLPHFIPLCTNLAAGSPVSFLDTNAAALVNFYSVKLLPNPAYTDPPPVVVLTAPSSNSTYTAAASVTISANANSLYDTISEVSFYANSVFLGSVTNVPYSVTATGFGAGAYQLTAVAVSSSGLVSTSAPININVAVGTGAPYGLTNRGISPAFYNMPATFQGSLPLLLSQTGVFTNTPNMTPVGGLIPYAPNTPLWSDGAVKTRYMGLPYNGDAITPNEMISFAPTGYWTFPAGTVFVKTFQLNTDTSNPNVLHRLETRLLVRDTNGAVYGVTYKWRPDNSDADLLSGSSNEVITITNAGDLLTTQTWYYPSPADCLQCHTPVANYVLGLNTRQLNGNQTYPATGVTDNQLRTLDQLGVFNPAFDQAGITNFEALSSVTNTSVSFQQRVRSYLDANCAQCHQPGGLGPTFDARYDTPLQKQNITNYPARFSLGVDNAKIVAPEDIWRSIMYLRINTTDPTIKMPPLDRMLIDSNGVAALTGWINSLPGTPALAPPTICPNGGTFYNQIGINIEPPDTNAAIYFTLDGSLPTTNSTLYTGAFVLTSSATVSASAFQTNYVNSVPASASFDIEPLQIASQSFSNGTLQLTLLGNPGGSYVLQASTNLTNWTPIVTNTAGTNVLEFVDPNASNYPARFYRILQQ